MKKLSGMIFLNLKAIQTLVSQDLENINYSLHKSLGIFAEVYGFISFHQISQRTI